MIAVAPFVGSSALESVAGMGEGQRMLVSSREELDKLPDSVMEGWNRVYVMSDAALDETEDENAGRPSGLHAKFLAVEHGWDVTWWIGSLRPRSSGCNPCSPYSSNNARQR